MRSLKPGSQMHLLPDDQKYWTATAAAINWSSSGSFGTMRGILESL
jgi:hypothetical protein